MAFTRFLFCVIWTFGLKVTTNLVKSLWISLVWLHRNIWWLTDQLLTISYSFLLERSPFCKAFLCCMIYRSKVKFSIVVRLNNDGLIGLLGMLLYIIGSACRSSEWSQCSPGLPWCPRFLLRLPPHVKYLLTFFITMLLSGVLCGKCNLNWLIVPAKLTLPK